ncbi:unnamed protein product, partial [Rotaria socialis]
RGQFEAASSTRSSNSGKDRRWYLTDGIVGDERAERAFGDDVIAVNGLCMKGQMRFNITSRLTSDRTTQLANSLKSKLEDIIRDRFSAKPPIEIDYSNDFEQPFVLLNADSDNILFILPPGDGGAESYFNNIVPHLSSYKLVIFNNYYYNLKEKNMKKGASFEALARLYIKYIKLIQLNGPYNFLGWSFGGVLSFEIARQLNNAGDPVANILMIDSYFNMSKAYLEIGKMNSVDEVNQISYSYLPQIDNEAFGLNIANMNIKIVLFKANLVKEGYLLNDQLEFFKYYINTTFNCLDTLVNHKYIQLFQMYDDSHFSWMSEKILRRRLHSKYKRNWRYETQNKALHEVLSMADVLETSSTEEEEETNLHDDQPTVVNSLFNDHLSVYSVSVDSDTDSESEILKNESNINCSDNEVDESDCYFEDFMDEMDMHNNNRTTPLYAGSPISVHDACVRLIRLAHSLSRQK